MHYEKKSKIKFCNYIAKSKAQTYQTNAYKKKPTTILMTGYRKRKNKLHYNNRDYI